MICILSKQNENGTYPNVGMDNRFLVRDLKTIRGVINRGVKAWKDSRFKIEVYSDDKFYSEKPQQVFYFPSRKEITYSDEIKYAERTEN